MRKAISGKIYDTRKSIAICRVYGRQEFSPGQRGRYTLYHTKAGNWFETREAAFWFNRLLGKLGDDYHAMKIFPLSENEAYNFLARNNEIKTIQTYFPDRIEEA